MANLSQFLAPIQGPRTGQSNGPGSNGYWQRKGYLAPGAYRFVVRRTGKHRFVGLGGGSGARVSPRASTPTILAGSGGGLAIHEHDLVKGDVVLVTVGAGGLGGTTNAEDGGTTTIVCAARGLNITVPGGRFAAANVRPTGANLGNYIGGNAPATISTTGTNFAVGGSSSGTPLGDGHVSQGGGGSGWGGPSLASGDGSGTTDSQIDPVDEGSGNRVRTSTRSFFWDIDDVVGSGGTSGTSGSNGGNGGGGGRANSGTGTGGSGGFGAGGGSVGQNSNDAGQGGSSTFGGGGGMSNALAAAGGNGGSGACLIFWDEAI